MKWLFRFVSLSINFPTSLFRWNGAIKKAKVNTRFRWKLTALVQIRVDARAYIIIIFLLNALSHFPDELFKII